MNKVLRYWSVLVLLFLVACNDEQVPVNGYVELTQTDAQTLVLKGYENTGAGFTVFRPDGFEHPFYIQEKNFYGEYYQFATTDALRLDAMNSIPEIWQYGSVPVIQGGAYWAKHTSDAAYTYVKFRVLLIEGNNVTIEYVVEKSEERPNLNANPSTESSVTASWGIPHLNADNYYVDHFVTLDGENVLNYSLEWNAARKHSEWVAFTFDNLTNRDVVNRTDAWGVDPLLPADMQVDNSYHTNDGFDRGHLCASEDRVYCKEANEQTFYFSNMSPQLASFNQGFWAVLEQQVRSWGRMGVPVSYSRVYVVKGGTMNDLLVNFTGEVKGADGKVPVTDENGFTTKGLACPKYYFMAVLTENGLNLNAIAFLVEHKEGLSASPSVDDLKACALSIDDLEQKTGLDFFCNLPDDIETEVERGFDVDAWNW